jgi:two-component system phosphate regulon sensor histidine kinase PhoR
VLRSRFFWKLYVAFALIVFVSALTLGLFVGAPLVQERAGRLAAALRSESDSLEPYALEVLRRGQNADAVERLRAVASSTGSRITLITPSGLVIADTEGRGAPIEDQLARAEVQQALQEGSGRAVHVDPANGVEWEHYARVLREEGEAVGILRVAAPLDGGWVFAGGHLVLGLAAGTGIALVLAFVFARGITRPISEMSHTAEDLRNGLYQSRVRSRPNNELGVLAGALDRLGEELTRRIADVTSDEAQLRAMLAGMVEGVIGVDDDDRVVFSNRAARELLSIDRDVEPGTRIWELVRRPELDALIQEARGTDAAARRELVLDHGGRELFLGAQAHSFRAAGTSGVVVVFDDITDLRRLERIRRDFVANVSHELKTPLTSIRGYVETLLEGALADPNNNERFLRKVLDNVMRLNHLVTDLLSLARIEAQEGSLALVEVDWRAIVTQAARRHEGAARLKGIDLRIEAPAGELRVLGDSESVTQVVDNLVDNAIKYTGDGGVVTLALRREGERGVLEVRDTGIGIPPEDLVRIFERFYRVDKARSRALGGTGLGLSIVKHLAQAMNGGVSVTSHVGRGSTFRVELNLIEPRGELLGHRGAPDASSGPGGRKLG